ncbi:MAG: serine-rich protein [Eubacterium sp.]|nr:serine-rich protein [Eubacterium sp.]
MLSLFELKRIMNPHKETEPADTFRVIDSWAEYDTESSVTPEERNLEYLCYELEVMDPNNGKITRFYKAIKFARVIRLPASAKQSTSLMDMQQEILSGVFENNYNFITVIANVIRPEPLGLLYLYGVQGVSQNLEEAKEIADLDFIGFISMMQGTYRVLELQIVKAKETEWLREKMYNMPHLTMVRGIPFASKTGEDVGNKGMGNKNANPDSEGTLEEIITGMADYEYVIEILSTPVYMDTLIDWQKRSQDDMTAWYSHLQGNTSLSFNLSIPMMYMANASQSQGWSKAYTDANTVSTAQGESFTLTDGRSIGESLSQTYSQSIGHSNGVSLSNSHSVGISETQGVTLGETYGHSVGHGYNQSVSHNMGISENYGQNVGQNFSEGFNEGESTNLSQGQSLTQGHSVGHGTSLTLGNSQNMSTSHNIGNSMNYGVNQSHSTSFGQTVGQTQGVTTNDSYSNGQSWGYSENHGQTTGKSYSQNGSHTEGFNTNSGVSFSPFGIGISGGGSSTDSNTTGYSNTTSTSTNDGYGWNEGGSFSESHGVSASNSVSQSQSMTNGFSTGMSQGWGVNESYGQSVGQGFSQSYGASENLSDSISNGQSVTLSNGLSAGHSISTGGSEGKSYGLGQNYGTGISTGESINVSDSYSKSLSQSYSLGKSETVGQTYGQSYSENTSESAGNSYGQNYGLSQSASNGNSYTLSNGTSHGTSNGTTGTMTMGTSSSMGLGPSIGYNKAHQWMDQHVKDLLELMEFQNERIKKALRGEGAFYTYVYIACPNLDALSAAQALAKSTWQNERAMVQPLQVLDLTDVEQQQLLYRFAAFSADITREDVYGVKEYKYCTVLLPEEFVAYTHLPRISEGGVFSTIQDVPKFSVPSMLKGDIYMGTILNAERYTFKNGYNTQFDYRIDENNLMHGFFTGASRSGKTVAATRFIAELSRVRRSKTGKRLRIVVLDPKQDWRVLARYVDAKRFNFYSMGNVNFRSVKINPWKVPKGVWPQIWIDGLIDIYCRAYGLLERGKQMVAEVVYELYTEAGVFDACDDEDWKEKVPELSAQVNFVNIYKRFEQKKIEAEDPKNLKAKMGNDTRDAFARLIERLSCFGREVSIERKLYGTSEGIGIDDLIGDDDVTVLESKGLENTFKNFIFGAITSGFYQYAIAHEGGYLADDQYETVLVIEEANEILIGTDTAGKGQDVSLPGESQFEQMLDQAAGYGLFIFAITQKIADMPSSVIANSGLVFIGRLKRADDISVATKTIGKDERYDDRDVAKWFPRCPTGWFVCQTSRTFDFKDADPILVKIAQLNIAKPSNIELDEILERKRLAKMITA